VFCAPTAFCQLLLSPFLMSALRQELPDDLPAGGDARVTLRRRKESRARRQRARKRNAAGALLFVVLAVAVIRWRSPQAPHLRVVWPSTEKLGAATLESGSTLVLRAGQPFVVSPVDAANWDVSWHYDGARGEGFPITWPPSGNSDTLEMSYRARAQGWQRLVSWLWPTRFVSLQGTAAVSLGEGRYVVVSQPGAPVRLSSRVVASHEVAPEARWNESALPLLEEAARRSSSLSSGATWTIVRPLSEWRTQNELRTQSAAKGTSASSTRNRTNAGSSPVTAKNDTATYAVLSSESFRDPLPALTQCAQIIAARAPGASIKWIARETPGVLPRALLWLSFNSPKTSKKRRNRAQQISPVVGSRGGWVVRNGDVLATSVDWWSTSQTPKPSP